MGAIPAEIFICVSQSSSNTSRWTWFSYGSVQSPLIISILQSTYGAFPDACIIIQCNFTALFCPGISALERLTAECWGSRLFGPSWFRGHSLHHATEAIGEGDLCDIRFPPQARPAHLASAARRSPKNKACPLQEIQIDGIGNEKLISHRRKEYL